MLLYSQGSEREIPKQKSAKANIATLRSRRQEVNGRKKERARARKTREGRGSFPRVSPSRA